MSDADAPAEPIADALTSVLRGADPCASVLSVRALSAGASRHTFEVETASGGHRERLVLQVNREGGLAGAIDVSAQVALLRAADAVGVPVASVVAFDDGVGGAPGAPFVLSRHVAGATLPQRILRDVIYDAARASFAADVGRVLAALHSVPTSGLPPLPDDDELERVAGWIEDVGDAVPAFELAIRWLRSHRPVALPPVLVHGDFRLGNVIVGPDGLRAVLDWEMCHLSDPAEDLAWVTLRPWRFRGPGEVGGIGSMGDLTGSYVAAGGDPAAVEPERLHWWRVLGTLKWGSICQRQARTHLDGLTRSVELAAIGRRVCETELDLLELTP
ncbi:phosphotransferase family protein [soil metagenome]